ncbi:MAG: 30S ribosomal protein S16 [Proteobacteria bacterium]|nr:MAG: 30S ribosomal protein S16 [Pseudomonadota bacterium]
MAVTLHLARHGVPKKPFYRIVASPHGSKRDGRFLEILGTYDPMKTPPAINLKQEKVTKWISNGALPTDVVRRIIAKSIPGLLEEREKNKLNKIQQARRKRKARVKAGSKPKK